MLIDLAKNLKDADKDKKYMMHVWAINIAIVAISILVAVLIAFELFQIRKINKSKLTTALSLLGGILVGEELVLLSSFIMWSSHNNPIYAYPSMVIASLSLLGLIVIYYIVRL